MISRRTRSRLAALVVLFSISVAIVPQARGAISDAKISSDVPRFLPGDGTPFWISMNFSGEPDTDYKIGVWIYGGKSSISKLWNRTGWCGRDCYFPIRTDAQGGWRENVALKISGAPEQGYNYYLKIRAKSADSKIIAEKKIYGAGNFSVIPAQECGWVEGYAERDGIYLSGEAVEAFDADAIDGGTGGAGMADGYGACGAPAFRCISENNGIDDYKKFAGYFRFALPAGNYTIRFPGGGFGGVSVVAGKTLTLNSRNFTYAVNSVTAFVSPDCSFSAISSEISEAQNSVCVNVYEFTNPFLCDSLRNCLRRNISVRLLLEKNPVSGMAKNEKWILENLSGNGAEVRFWKKPSRRVFDHAKYAIIDNRTIIVESANWGATGVPKDSTFGNREWGIMVRDKRAAHGLLDVFESDWSYAENAEKMQIAGGSEPSRDAPGGAYSPVFRQENFTGNFSARFVFSPENSERDIINLIRSANLTICVEQLYIYTYWGDYLGELNPFVAELVNASRRGVEVRVILNHNSEYEKTYRANSNQNAAAYLRKRNISVKLFETGKDGWGIFSNIHNKGVIVDNRSVLVSSINWNKNSVRNNRELGLVVESEQAAQYYADAFFRDWNTGKDGARGGSAMNGTNGASGWSGKMPGFGTGGIIFALWITASCFSAWHNVWRMRRGSGRR